MNAMCAALYWCVVHVTDMGRKERREYKSTARRGISSPNPTTVAHRFHTPFTQHSKSIPSTYSSKFSSHLGCCAPCHERTRGAASWRTAALQIFTPAEKSLVHSCEEKETKERGGTITSSKLLNMQFPTGYTHHGVGRVCRGDNSSRWGVAERAPGGTMAPQHQGGAPMAEKYVYEEVLEFPSIHGPPRSKRCGGTHTQQHQYTQTDRAKLPTL